jgi:iron complex outermembrane receptor protein
MKPLFLLSVLSSVLSLTANAQDPKTASVRGSVMSSQKGVESATVSLLKAKDSSIAKIAVSDKAGKYEMEKLYRGKYLLMVQAVGMEKKYSSAFELTAENPSYNAAPLELTMAASNLSDVTVNAKKAFIEQKAGKMVVNVDASPSSAGASALDILEKSPGVTIDRDGNISLKGKAGVMIMIDGKPTYLSSADLSNMLKSMSSSQLDQIEIMTNPPAKYDAAGNSGMINIKTKKQIIKGSNGSYTAGVTQGQYTRTNHSLNLNYRKDKFNVFGSYNFNYGEFYNNLEISRVFYEADKRTVNSTSDQKTRMHNTSFYNSFKAGIDYNFSKKTVAGIVVNGSLNNRKEDPQSVSYIRDATGAVLSKLIASNDNKTNFSSLSFNMNLKHTIDSTGKEITSDLDYIRYTNDGTTLLSTNAYDAANLPKGGSVLLRGEVPGTIDIVSGKVDYVHPFSKTLKLEAGVKSSLVKSDNRIVYERNAGSGWTPDSRSNAFVYEENINAAYASLNKQWKKLNLQTGLRVENTISKGIPGRKPYTNAFPNIGLSYEVNKKNSLSLSYSKRINRPNYNDLNPFTFFLDSLTFGQGNPMLLPEKTHNFEASHSLGRFLTTTINYTRTVDVITQLLKQNTADKKTYQTRDNFGRMQQIGIAVMANVPVKKWWNANMYVNAFENHYQGMYNTDPIDIRMVSVMMNMTNSFTIGKKGWTAEASGFYRTKGADGLLIANAMGGMNIGAGKLIMKKKGTVRLTVRDIFWTQRFSGYAKYSDVDVKLASRRDSRQVAVSFNYRFGKTNIAPARKRATGATDEEKRAGAGN